MASPITIAERREPTLWNRYALSGARVGLLAVMGLVALTAASAALGPAMPLVGGAMGQAVGAFMASASGWVLGIGAAAAGFMVGTCAYAGGLSGAREVEHNKVAGRTVYPPTLFNEGLGHGIMDGLLLGAAAIAATALIVPVGGMMATVGLAFVSGAALIGTGFLGYYQADAQRDTMARDYMAAQQQVMAQGKGMGGPEGSLSQMLEGLAHSKSKSSGVTADEMQQLNSRMREGRGASGAVERLEADRAQQAMLTDPQR